MTYTLMSYGLIPYAILHRRFSTHFGGFGLKTGEGRTIDRDEPGAAKGRTVSKRAAKQQTSKFPAHDFVSVPLPQIPFGIHPQPFVAS